MSDSHLPDDVSQWPHDPFAILGVDRRADEKTLRSAYVRLIRHFKPEQHPEAFRRIRDAYEFLREGVGQWQYLDGGAETRSPHRDAAKQNPPDTGTLKPADVALGPADEAWLAAENDDLAGAYARLRALHAEQPDDEHLCVRLYWIARLAPQIDPTVPRLEWLRQAIRHGHRGGMAATLYAREVERYPQEIASTSLDDLFGPAVPLGEMLGIMAARWRGLALADLWRPIIEEVAALRPRFEDDQIAWLRLLLDAISHAAWIDEGDAGDAIREWSLELDDQSDAHQELENELDRRDLLVTIVEQIAELERKEALPAEWTADLRCILRFAWNRKALDGRWMKRLVQMVAQPIETLWRWNQVGAIAPLVLQQLANQALHVYHDWFGEFDRSLTEPLVDAFSQAMSDADWADYEKVQIDLLAFCLSQQITSLDLYEVLQAAVSPFVLTASGVQDLILGDAVLALLTAGMRIVEST